MLAIGGSSDNQGLSPLPHDEVFPQITQIDADIHPLVICVICGQGCGWVDRIAVLP